MSFCPLARRSSSPPGPATPSSASASSGSAAAPAEEAEAEADKPCVGLVGDRSPPPPSAGDSLPPVAPAPAPVETVSPLRRLSRLTARGVLSVCSRSVFMYSSTSESDVASRAAASASAWALRAAACSALARASSRRRLSSRACLYDVTNVLKTEKNSSVLVMFFVSSPYSVKARWYVPSASCSVSLSAARRSSASRRKRNMRLGKPSSGWSDDRSAKSASRRFSSALCCSTKSTSALRTCLRSALNASAGFASSSRKPSVAGMVCVTVLARKCSSVRLLDADDLVSTSLLIDVTLKP
ncbi:hypothetical protein DMC30DRAFT_386450 [Rhodotorula diobovata]|uniref:Uncharacterized protein n=1 Tax=Rhodotorula diobovata TaxID=5288 RepID=A0A5C5GA61_9BASI|nr:hypothetical protein DMC30DRAFT_386450 [Rhodotorula diobovata]